MIFLEMEQDHVTVFRDDVLIGRIELYTNTYHMQNQYLKINQFLFDDTISAALFQQLADQIERPLQIMARSDRTDLIDFIVAGGFVCKRKCYEIEATQKDYIGANRQMDILYTQREEAEYDRCCRLMYKRYQETHKTINPLTADYDTFIRNFPIGVFYQKAEGDILQFAFTEENEIAYVYSQDDTYFRAFAEALISKLFAEYQTLCLEADDCDSTAMVLKSLFGDDGNVSNDTYVYERQRERI